MTRPSAEEVERALGTLGWAAEYLADPLSVTMLAPTERLYEAREVLRAAIAPHRIGATKEVAEALCVDPANLNDVRGLPEPVWRLPRPAQATPNREMRLWDMDEIEPFAREFRERRRTKRKGAKDAAA